MADMSDVLREAVERVLAEFEQAEAAGGRSRERQYVIEMLKPALAEQLLSDDAEYYAALERKEMSEPRGFDDE